MRAAIAYYDPPQRPAPGARPDFTTLPLTAVPVTIGDLRGRAGERPAGTTFTGDFAHEEPARCRT